MELAFSEFTLHGGRASIVNFSESRHTFVLTGPLFHAVESLVGNLVPATSALIALR
jgi:hypothetical protein